VVRAAGETILAAIAEFDDLAPEEIRKDRREKFLSMGRAS
jgi:acetyl-CoA carboxylase alpha subunit